MKSFRSYQHAMMDPMGRIFLPRGKPSRLSKKDTIHIPYINMSGGTLLDVMSSIGWEIPHERMKYHYKFK